MDENSIKSRVLKGAAYLDRVVPDWAGLIDLDRFCFELAAVCIVGQLGGENWNKGLELLDLPQDQGFQQEFGFDMQVEEYQSANCSGFLDEFQFAWFEQIEQRLTP